MESDCPAQRIIGGAQEAEGILSESDIFSAKESFVKGARSATGVRISEPMKRELTQQDLIRQPAGVVSVAEVLLYLAQDRYLDKREAAAYTCLSTRNLEARLPEIPHYRVGRKILFKKSELDRWLEQFREGDSRNLDLIADEAVKALRGGD